jgi:hypothetical protein
MSDNVIKGPWPEIYKPASEDFLYMEAADDMVNDFSDAIFQGLESAGFDNYDDPCYSKDYALMVHAIRSVVYKLNGQYHPCQDISDNLFYQHQDGSLEMASGVHVEFE